MKSIVVTGANKGIGRAIVAKILETDADSFVFLGSRSESRGQQARQLILQQSRGYADRLQVLPLDVTSESSVAAAAASIRQRFAHSETPLYGLVNNAGIGFPQSELAPTLDVNTYGIKRVCTAMIPLLAKGGRVVNITSASGPIFVSHCSQPYQQLLTNADVDWPQLQAFMNECLAIKGGPAAFQAKGLADGNAYGLSKACANALTMLLAKQHPHLHINACTPGFIETDLTRHYAEGQGKTPQQMGMKPPEQGTRAALALLFDEVDGNGRYYGSDGIRSPLDRYRAPGDPPG